MSFFYVILLHTITSQSSCFHYHFPLCAKIERFFKHELTFCEAFNKTLRGSRASEAYEANEAGKESQPH